MWHYSTRIEDCNPGLDTMDCKPKGRVTAETLGKTFYGDDEVVGTAG